MAVRPPCGGAVTSAYNGSKQLAANEGGLGGAVLGFGSKLRRGAHTIV